MIKQYVFIEKYDWHLLVIYNANRDLLTTAESLWLINCPPKILKHALKEVIVSLNTGLCFTNIELKSTVICIAEATSNGEFINTIIHELKHLQSHICSYYGIDEKSEEAAYLIGDVGEELFKAFKYELDES